MEKCWQDLNLYISFKYFRSLCSITELYSKLTNIQKKIFPGNFRQERVNLAFLSAVLNDIISSVKKGNYITLSTFLTKASFFWKIFERIINQDRSNIFILLQIFHLAFAISLKGLDKQKEQQNKISKGIWI